jgi:hypothetical protein
VIGLAAAPTGRRRDEPDRSVMPGIQSACVRVQKRPLHRADHLNSHRRGLHTRVHRFTERLAEELQRRRALGQRTQPRKPALLALCDVDPHPPRHRPTHGRPSRASARPAKMPSPKHLHPAPAAWAGPLVAADFIINKKRRVGRTRELGARRADRQSRSVIGAMEATSGHPQGIHSWRSARIRPGMSLCS